MPTAPSSYDGITAPDDWTCATCGRRRDEHCFFTRHVYDFVAMLRIKNEERWIAEVIESLLPMCRRIFILDDHSTDRTAEICARYSEVILFASHFVGFNEARDKNWMLDQVMLRCEPKWILCIDGDEVLEPGGQEIIRRHVAEHPCHAYSFQVIYLWNDRKTARVDRIYGDFWRPSIFSPFHPRPGVPDDIKVARECRFMATPFGRHNETDEPNLHCSSVPQRFLHEHQRLPVRLLHYGYMDRAQRVAKLDFYTSIDWGNRAEDGYRHMVQGDDVSIEELPRVKAMLASGVISKSEVEHITNVPADEYLMHAGPIRLEELYPSAPVPQRVQSPRAAPA